MSDLDVRTMTVPRIARPVADQLAFAELCEQAWELGAEMVGSANPTQAVIDVPIIGTGEMVGHHLSRSMHEIPVADICGQSVRRQLPKSLRNTLTDVVATGLHIRELQEPDGLHRQLFMTLGSAALERERANLVRIVDRSLDHPLPWKLYEPAVKLPVRAPDNEVGAALLELFPAAPRKITLLQPVAEDRKIEVVTEPW